MLFLKSAGAVVVYRNPDGQIEYLLLLHNHGDAEAAAIKDKKHYRERDYWNFPKGTIEEGESVVDTAKREIFEETGLCELTFLPGFKVNESYFFRVPKDHHRRQGELIYKKVIFFLAESKNKDVKISHEHIGYEWANFEQAARRLSKFRSSLKILKKADKYLKKHARQ